MTITLDSYALANVSSQDGVYSGVPYRGQSFQCVTSGVLTQISFSLLKVGSPTGNVYAVIFAHSGTYGTSSVGTGSVLATSNAISAASITGSFVQYNFVFAGAEKIALDKDAYYVCALNFSGGDVSNYVALGIDTTSPAHAGNACLNNGTSWSANNTKDTCFIVTGIETLLAAVNSPVAVAETAACEITTPISAVNISVNSNTSVLDTVTETVDIPGISVQDTVAVAESISSEMDRNISVSDASTIIENALVSLDDIEVVVFSTASTMELANVGNSIPLILIDATSIAESVSLYLERNLSVVDASSVAESIDIVKELLHVSVVDLSTVSEFTDVSQIATIAVAVNDSTSLIDVVTAFAGNLSVSKVETISTVDVVSALLSDLALSKVETVSIAEDIDLCFDECFSDISVTSLVSVSDLGSAFIYLPGENLEINLPGKYVEIV